jgi:hypothetical protein
MSETASIWITNGMHVFSDVYVLAATQPGTAGQPPGAYSGFVDPACFVGSATIAAERSDDQLFDEAEWCLTFPEGIDTYLSDPERVSPSTPVTLQGFIEGKWIDRFLPGMDRYVPPSAGNNVLAEGVGIATTLGALDEGAAVGRVEISYPLANGRGTRTQIMPLEELKGRNVLGLVREVLRFSRDHGERIDGIDLGAVGDRATVLNEPSRFLDAAKDLSLPVPPPPEAFPRVAKHAIEGVLAEGIGCPPQEPMRIVTYGKADKEVGEGVLVWHAAPASNRQQPTPRTSATTSAGS